MSVVIRLKVPIEMHYTVIPMRTSKVNSSLTIIQDKMTIHAVIEIFYETPLETLNSFVIHTGLTVNVNSLHCCLGYLQKLS